MKAPTHRKKDKARKRRRTCADCEHYRPRRDPLGHVFKECGAKEEQPAPDYNAEFCKFLFPRI